MDSRCVSLDESARPQFGVGLPQLLFGIHHDRPVPRYRLLDRLSRHEQETYPVVAGLHDDFIAAIEQDEEPVRDVGESTARIRAPTRSVVASRGSDPSRNRPDPSNT